MTHTSTRESIAKRSFLASHPRGVFITIVMGIALVAAAVFWFQPQKLVIDQQVNEALPGIGTGGGERVAGIREGNPAAGSQGDSAPTKSDVASGHRTLASGRFQSLEHDTAGRAALLELPGGRRYLRFEDLATSNGPDLRVYLSRVRASNDWYAYGERFTDLGALKGNLGDQNYPVPADIDLSRYRSAVIWCRRFTVGFGVAPLR
jgi:hypothetical protein